MLARTTYALALTAALLTAPATTAVAADDAQVDDARLLLLLDASRSMEDPDAGGEPKIEAARTALRTVVEDLDPEQSVGLRVFGGDVELDQPMDALCTDSQLAVPIGTDNADDLMAAVDAYSPKGETPIAYALQQAAHDLGDSGQRTILLVSDGVATCAPDPCEVAEELSAHGLDLVVHTVGLGADPATRDQLQCIADATGGDYADAGDADTLTTALTQISTRAFRPFTVEGRPVEGTLDVADAPEVSAGQWTDTMAEDEEHAKHYLVRRDVQGSILHVGTTLRPARGEEASYSVRLETPDGAVCGMAMASPWSAGEGGALSTTGLTSAGQGYDPQGACATDDELVLRIYAAGDAPIDRPFEMVVIEEPPVANADALPERSTDVTWQGLTADAPVAEVVGGASFNDAPLLEPGETYSSELTRGEITIFRVAVEHGQRLEALLEVAEPTGLLAETTGGVSDIADVTVIGPNRAFARSATVDTGGLSSRAILQPDSAAQGATSTYEVRWANHASANTVGASLAGDYYVAVSLASNAEQLLPIPFTITTDVVGDVSGVPEYADAAEQTADDDATTATAGPGDESAATTTPEGTPGAATAPDLDPESTTRSLGLLLGALGVVVLLAGVIVIAIRRRPSE